MTRTLTILSTFALFGCYSPGAEAPNYALGTYRGVVREDSGSCPFQAAELTLTVVRHSAFGEWHFERQNAPTYFDCAWVNRTGVFSSNSTPPGVLQYVIGYFVDNGTTIDATLDAGNCSYTGKLSRIQSLPNPAESCAGVPSFKS
jgi:hypothetical protein